MKKGVLVAIGLVLLISIGVGTVWVLKSPLSAAKPAQGVKIKPYVVQRVDEIPLFTHRQQAIASIENPTTLAPWGIAIDKFHGFVWVAEPGCQPTPKCPTATTGTLGQYALSDGSFIADFNEPNGYTSPLFVAVDDSGDIWFTQPTTDALGEFNPQSGIWSSWPLQKGSSPFDLTFDAQGNLWFTEFGTNSIGFFNTHTNHLVENPIPTTASNPYGITLDSHGNIWFAENSAGINQIGSFKPAPSGAIKITEYGVNGTRPHLITSDKAGNIWYSEGFAGHIGEFNAQTGINVSLPAYGGTCPSPANCGSGIHISGIYVDNNTGNVWFSDSLSQRVGYIIPSTGQVVAQTLQKNNAHPYDGLIIDGSNRVWFTSEFALTLTIWPTNSVK